MSFRDGKWSLSRVDPAGVETELAVFTISRFALICRDLLQAQVSAKSVLYRVTDDEGETVEWGDDSPDQDTAYRERNEQ